MPAALLNRLEQDLTSLASAAVHTLTSVRHALGPTENTSLKPMAEAAEQWLTLVAEALASATEIHQALQAHTALLQDNR